MFGKGENSVNVQQSWLAERQVAGSVLTPGWAHITGSGKNAPLNLGGAT
jgi:hypothetical protein